MMPVQYVVQWLAGHDYGKGTNLISDWYLWPVIILWLVLFFYLDRRFGKWLNRRLASARKLA